VTFKQKVQNTQEIKNCYQKGLQSLREKDKDKIKAQNTRRLNGSVNIDECLKNKYPNASRWDYAIGYNNQTYFVEVHPVIPKEIKELAKKLNWLKNWKRNTPFHNDNNFYWVASGKVGISPKSKYEKKIARLGIKLRSILKLE
jgi:hypothetical protein